MSLSSYIEEGGGEWIERECVANKQVFDWVRLAATIGCMGIGAVFPGPPSHLRHNLTLQRNPCPVSMETDGLFPWKLNQRTFVTNCDQWVCCWPDIWEENGCLSEGFVDCLLVSLVLD